jgi:hypothetical protein
VLAASPVPDDDSRAHRWVVGEDVLDLAELDAVAVDLHLVVDPAEELQGAVGQPSRLVPGPVQPPPGPASWCAMNAAVARGGG